MAQLRVPVEYQYRRSCVCTKYKMKKCVECDLLGRSVLLCDARNSPFISGLEEQDCEVGLGTISSAVDEVLTSIDLGLEEPLREKDSFARSKEKNPSGSLEDFLGLSGFFDDISSTATEPHEDLMMWRMPTPPQSPPRDNISSELPDLEESMDLTSLVQSQEHEDLDKKDFTLFDTMSTDISDLINFVSGPEIEDFMEQESELDMHLFTQPKKLCTEDVMIGDDIMWSESSASITSGLKCREIRTQALYAEEQALQSDVLPPVDLTRQDKLSNRERSIALGTDTPSDSGNEEEDREVEVDVVTEHPSDLSLLISPEQISVRVKAKRASAAKEPKVEIEMDPSDSCFCPSASASRTGRHHHHHVPVDHHNYSLPPSPAHRRSPPAHSRHSSPESTCRDRTSSIQKKGLSSHTVESALQQALQIKAAQPAQLEDFGSQVYHALHGTRKGGVQKGHKRGRVGRPRNTPAASVVSQSSSVSSSPTSSPSASPSQTVHGACRQRQSLMDFEDDIDRRNQHNVLERNRRVLLQMKFQALRTLVPAIKDQEKASKVVILNSAERHIKELRSQESQLERERKALAARSEALRRRLAQLSRKRDSSHQY